MATRKKIMVRLIRDRMKYSCLTKLGIISTIFRHWPLPQLVLADYVEAFSQLHWIDANASNFNRIASLQVPVIPRNKNGKSPQPDAASIQSSEEGVQRLQQQIQSYQLEIIGTVSCVPSLLVGSRKPRGLQQQEELLEHPVGNPKKGNVVMAP